MPDKPSILEFFLTKAPKIAKAAKVMAQIVKDANARAAEELPKQKALPRKKPTRDAEGTIVKLAFLIHWQNITIKEIDEKLKEFYTSNALPFFEIYEREIFSSHSKDDYHVCMFFDVLVNEADRKAALIEMKARALELVQKSSEVIGFWARLG